ncbi:hypothetical protein [Coralloluteibacterium stylophorae]|uniref:Uncharacterized protein n=1 Tax=Coralloluteibacterium stylophorae TaxID=1776034 RepID=A0A8J7VS17_9GAMM|nr:hypothetical protein [Coralloluteibacterium stylophorae]MBS7457868.1 hypothetical protein [Coralloluteibacterium stylophorae]
MILVVEDRERFDLEQLPPEPSNEELKLRRAQRLQARQDRPQAVPREVRGLLSVPQAAAA